MIMVKLAVQNF